MALRILDTCINCDVCAPACPNGAISQGETIYEIAPPKCMVVCPVECIELDPSHPESKTELQRKFEALQREMA